MVVLYNIGDMGWDEVDDVLSSSLAEAFEEDACLSLGGDGLSKAGVGADAEALLLDDTVESLEPDIGYLAARDPVYQAFYTGPCRSRCAFSDR